MPVYKPRMFWPVTIDNSNNKIYYYDDVANGEGTVANGTYYTPEALADAVMTAIENGTNPLLGISVTVSATGRFVFTWNAYFQMRWNVTTNSIYVVLGQVAVLQSATTSDGGVTYVATGTYQHQNGWYAEVAPRFDSGPIRDREMDVVTRNVAGQTKFLTEAELAERTVKFSWLPPEKVFNTSATGSYSYQAIETFWLDGRARFRYWEDAATLLSPVDYVLGTKTIKRFDPIRQHVRKALYEIELQMWGYVA